MQEHPGEKLGRWPTNLVLVHGPGCRCLGTVKAKGTSISGKSTAIRRTGVHAQAGGHQTIGRVQPVFGYSDANGLETVPAWDCQPDCPVRVMDEQSAERGVHSAGAARVYGSPNKAGLFGLGGGKTPRLGDAGGASRFYPQFTDLAGALDWLSRLVNGPS